MKIKLAIFLLSLSTSLLAQPTPTINFNRSQDRNSVSPVDCKINHQRILHHYNAQLYSELSRIMVGIKSEEKNEETKDLLILKKISTDLVTKILLTENLYEQTMINTFNLKPNLNFIPKKTFSTKHLNISIQKSILHILKKANSLIENKKFSFTNHALHDFGERIKSDFIENFVEKIFQGPKKAIIRIITGVAIQESINNLTPATLRSVTLNFSKELLVGASRGTILTLITYPLHGYTYSREVQWIKALKNYPELIINPDWMTELKIDGNPIRNHCLAIDRHSVIISELLENLLEHEEKKFIGVVKEYMNSSEPGTFRSPKLDIPADATYVDGIGHGQEEEKLPKWAEKE